jgi:hypothetical protein
MSQPLRFTEAELAKLAPETARYTVFDPTLPAFGLRVSPSGVRTFVVFYRVGRRQRMATIGRLGPLTLDQARRKARTMFGAAAGGQDPLAGHDAARQAVSVRTAASRWLTEHITTRRKPATLRLYRLGVRPSNRHDSHRLSCCAPSMAGAACGDGRIGIPAAPELEDRPASAVRRRGDAA